MENKVEKRFKVRLELGMCVTIGVESSDEESAEEYAMSILQDVICAPGDSVYFCEVDNSDVYVNYSEIKPLETYESENE